MDDPQPQSSPPWLWIAVGCLVLGAAYAAIGARSDGASTPATAPAPTEDVVETTTEQDHPLELAAASEVMDSVIAAAKSRDTEAFTALMSRASKSAIEGPRLQMLMSMTAQLEGADPLWVGSAVLFVKRKGKSAMTMGVILEDGEWRLGTQEELPRAPGR